MLALESTISNNHNFDMSETESEDRHSVVKLVNIEKYSNEMIT